MNRAMLPSSLLMTPRKVSANSIRLVPEELYFVFCNDKKATASQRLGLPDRNGYKGPINMDQDARMNKLNRDYYYFYYYSGSWEKRNVGTFGWNEQRSATLRSTRNVHPGLAQVWQTNQILRTSAL